MTVLIAALLVLVGLTGLGVVLSRDPRRQVFAIAGNGLALSLLFLVLQAPDVALSEIVVGAAATPLLFLAAMVAIRIGAEPPGMTPRARTMLLAVAGLVLLAPVVRVVLALPGFGAPSATHYADAVNALGPAARHVANQVSAVNFDFRGFDTLGEEFMLLCAVTGAVLLLRGGRGEDLTTKAGRLEGRAHEPRSDAVLLICRLFGPLILLFGLYVALHVTATPGGGFQGGVIAATGLLLIYLGEGYVVWRKLVRSTMLDAIEGGGALLFALAALAPVAMGLPVLQNILPLGTLKDMLSGGLMLVENAGVFFAVAGGFGQLFIEFLEETRAATSEVEG